MEPKTIEELFDFLNEKRDEFEHFEAKNPNDPKVNELIKEIEDIKVKIRELFYIGFSKSIISFSSTTIHGQQLIIDALEKGSQVYDSNYLEVKEIIKEAEKIRKEYIDQLNRLELWHHYPYSLFFKEKREYK